MLFEVTAFRHADVIMSQPEFIYQRDEVFYVIDSISDEDLIETHQNYSGGLGVGGPKSLSVAINSLLSERFVIEGWIKEPAIFHGPEYQHKRWRLDFAKDDVSIEVAFNHREAIAWNLIKPVLASEMNHVQKQIDTKIGIVITATSALTWAGGFDNACGTYENFLEYLPALRNQLTTPLLIIGLLPPDTFRIVQDKDRLNRKYGLIERI